MTALKQMYFQPPDLCLSLQLHPHKIRFEDCRSFPASFAVTLFSAKTIGSCKVVCDHSGNLPQPNEGQKTH